MRTRHMYQKDPDRDAICTCGQGRAEDVHQMLVWRKARTGNWLSDSTSRGAVYRCRASGVGWVPESGENPNWISLGSPTTLAAAKQICEGHRVADGH